MAAEQPYRIVKRDSAEDCRRTVRYDRDYQYALIGPLDGDGRRYVISCSMGPGGTLKRFMEIANEAYRLGLEAGLQHNRTIDDEPGQGEE